MIYWGSYYNKRLFVFTCVCVWFKPINCIFFHYILCIIISMLFIKRTDRGVHFQLLFLAHCCLLGFSWSIWRSPRFLANYMAFDHCSIEIIICIYLFCFCSTFNSRGKRRTSTAKSIMFVTQGIRGQNLLKICFYT